MEKSSIEVMAPQILDLLEEFVVHTKSVSGLDPAAFKEREARLMYRAVKAIMKARGIHGLA